MAGVADPVQALPDPVQALQALKLLALQHWRARYPPRGLCLHEATPGPGMPGKRHPRAWTRFPQEEVHGGLRQFHFVPFLLRCAFTPLPDGVCLIRCPDSARLEQVRRSGTLMEHYTNIHRVEVLAVTHPLVSTAVDLHKMDKSEADNQSPWDLKLELSGASGAKLYVGVSVIHWHGLLCCHWFMSGRDATPHALEVAKVVFQDIFELRRDWPPGWLLPPPGCWRPPQEVASERQRAREPAPGAASCASASAAEPTQVSQPPAGAAAPVGRIDPPLPAGRVPGRGPSPASSAASSAAAAPVRRKRAASPAAASQK